MESPSDQKPHLEEFLRQRKLRNEVGFGGWREMGAYLDAQEDCAHSRRALDALFRKIGRSVVDEKDPSDLVDRARVHKQKLVDLSSMMDVTEEEVYRAMLTHLQESIANEAFDDEQVDAILSLLDDRFDAVETQLRFSRMMHRGLRTA